jgi:hypothetical protein
MIFLVKSENDLLNIFLQAGFVPADKISFQSIKQI